MVKFQASIEKFEKKGEKTNWTYVSIPLKIASKLKPNNSKTFRVKGKIDDCEIEKIALWSMGEGEFILPLNANLRKRIGKGKGEIIDVELMLDESNISINNDLLLCLSDEPKADYFFNSLAKSQQNYFSNWINEAKTEATKSKRIALAINALSNEMNYPMMLRSLKNKN